MDGKTPQEATQAGGVFKPRMEILPPAQLGLWPWLRPAAGLGFTLYGGTAVALRLGHRSSVDFDFFSEMPLDAGLLREALPFVGKSETLQERKDTLTVLALPGLPGQIQGLPGQGRVKVSFFGGIGFGRVGEPGVTGDGVLQVASLDDLMATKLKVVQQRAEAKDYRDIAAMLAAGAGLSRGLASARQMFGPAFQPAESLRALSYFGDGDLKTLGRDERQAILKAVGEVGDLPAVAILARRLTILAGEPPGLASGEEGGGFGPEPR